MSNLDTEQEEYQMSYVINIEDGAGREYFISDSGTAIALDAKGGDKPMIFKTDKQIIKKREALEAEYPATCMVYVIERKEFEARRSKHISPSED